MLSKKIITKNRFLTKKIVLTKKILCMVFLFFILCQFLSLSYTVEVAGLDRFGIRAKDGTLIQPYFEKLVSLGTKTKIIGIRLPTDEETLELDEFIIYLDFRDGINRSVKVEIFEETTYLNREYDEELGNWIYVNKTGYVDMVANITLNIPQGYGSEDPYITEYKVSTKNWSQFKFTDKRQLMVVTYKELKIQFFHLTDPYIVPVTYQRGFLQMLFIVYMLFMVFCFVVGIIFFSWMQKRNAGVWFSFDFSTWALLLTWSGIIMIIWALAQGMTQDDLMRSLLMFPLEIIEPIIAFFLSMWIPSLFRKKPLELFIFKWKFPTDIYKQMTEFLTQDEKQIVTGLITSDVLVLDTIQSKKGNKYYFDSDSMLEIIGNIFYGSLRIINFDECFKIITGNKIILLTRSWNYNDPEKPQKPKALQSFFVTFYVLIFVVFSLAFCLLINMMMLFGVILFCIAVTYTMYILREVTYHHRKLWLDPVTRSSLMVAYDSDTISKLEHAFIDLSNKYATLKKESTIEIAKMNTSSSIKESSTLIKFILFINKKLYGADYFKDKPEVTKFMENDSFIKKLEKMEKEEHERSEKDMKNNTEKVAV